ncbi:MAG: TetR/AcrR family transcriptional regulator [Actinobacteria bacterium]|nr:TetR/AcrR family transcriptional regulator [Actinomycetota bacterium]
MSGRTQGHDGGSRAARHAPVERRTVFLDAAVDVIRADGPGVSMDRLARAAGVTKPILYRVFGDRKGLLRALADRWTVELDAALAPLGSSDADDDPENLLRGTIDAYLALVERDPALYRFLTERLAGTADELITGLVQDVARRVEAVLRTRLARAGADTSAAEPWAHALVGTVHQVGDWWITRGSMPRAEVVEHLVALLWHGMAAEAGVRPAVAPGSNEILRRSSRG